MVTGAALGSGDVQPIATRRSAGGVMASWATGKVAPPLVIGEPVGLAAINASASLGSLQPARPPSIPVANVGSPVRPLGS